VLLFLVRHGVTQHNTDRIFMGHDPVPLSPTGREQIRRLAERLGASPPTRIVSSDILRAHESAEIIAQRLRLPIETSAELREVDVLPDDEVLSAPAKKWKGAQRPSHGCTGSSDPPPAILREIPNRLVEPAQMKLPVWPDFRADLLASLVNVNVSI
jgi:broad specificity phosphatase PhoE